MLRLDDGTIFLEPVGAKCILETPAGTLEHFFIVGEKRFFDDNKLLDECEKKALIEKRKQEGK